MNPDYAFIANDSAALARVANVVPSEVGPNNFAPAIPADFDASLCVSRDCEGCNLLRAWVTAARAGGEDIQTWMRKTSFSKKKYVLRAFFRWMKNPEDYPSYSIGYFDLAPGERIIRGYTRYCSVPEAIARERFGEPVKIVLTADEPLAERCYQATATQRQRTLARRCRESIDGWDSHNSLSAKAEQQ